MTATQRKRCARWQLYEYVLSVVLNNHVIQGRRRAFRVKDTEPLKFGISESESYKVMTELAQAGVVTRDERHPRKWRLSEWYREHLSKIEFEQRKLIAERLVDAVRNDIIIQVKADPDIKNEVLDAVGFTPSEARHFRL